VFALCALGAFNRAGCRNGSAHCAHFAFVPIQHTTTRAGLSPLCHPERSEGPSGKRAHIHGCCRCAHGRTTTPATTLTSAARLFAMLTVTRSEKTCARGCVLETASAQKPRAGTNATTDRPVMRLGYRCSEHRGTVLLCSKNHRIASIYDFIICGTVNK
jgi:hypothetical protein